MRIMWHYVLISMLIINLGCSSRQSITKVSSCPKINYLDPPTISERIQPKVLKEYQNYKAPSGGAVVFEKNDWEDLKFNLKSFRIWSESILKSIDEHNECVNKLIKQIDNSNKKRWF